MSTRTPGTSPRGRPRDTVRQWEILAATRQVFGRVGYHRLTFEDVAREAGVGKATLYRWWPDKGALVTEALQRYPTAPRRPHLPLAGSMLERLGALLAYAVSEMDNPRDRQTAALALDPAARAELPDLPVDRLLLPTVRDVERLLSLGAFEEDQPHPRAVALRPVLVGLVLAALATPGQMTVPLDALVTLLSTDSG